METEFLELQADVGVKRVVLTSSLVIQWEFTEQNKNQVQEFEDPALCA